MSDDRKPSGPRKGQPRRKGGKPPAKGAKGGARGGGKGGNPPGKRSGQQRQVAGDDRVAAVGRPAQRSCAAARDPAAGARAADGARRRHPHDLADTARASWACRWARPATSSSGPSSTSARPSRCSSCSASCPVSRCVSSLQELVEERGGLPAPRSTSCRPSCPTGRSSRTCRSPTCSCSAANPRSPMS
jgi:hypothetical protein